MRDSSLINWLTWGGEPEYHNFYLLCPWCGSGNLKLLDSEESGVTRGGLKQWSYVRACLDCKRVTETSALMHNIGSIV